MIPYIIDPLIDDLPLKQNERITAVSAHDRNVYIGTSIGNVLHYHLFEDATDYLQITMMSVGGKEIAQMVASEQLQRLFVLENSTLFVFSLPELSPMSTRQLKNIRHVCLADDGASLMLIKQSSIQIAKLEENSWKLIQDFKYEGAVLGTAPMNNLILLANSKAYEILDTSSGRSMPLFDYKSGADVSPVIVPFETPNATEYLLTVASDENTSIAQFINTKGDATRGTLTWLNLGYPQGGVTIKWPYTFALFEHSILVSSLETLETVTTLSIEEKVSEANASGKHLHPMSIQKANVFFADKSLEGVIGSPLESRSNIVFFNESKLFNVHQENEVVSANKAFQQAMETNEFDQFSAIAHGDSKYVHILKTMVAFLTDTDPIALLLERKDGQLIIDADLALRLLGYEAQFLSVYPGLREVMEMWDFKDEAIAKRYLQNLKPTDMSADSRILSYKLLPASDISSLVSEDNWTFSVNDETVTKILIERNLLSQVSHIFQMTPKSSAVVSAYKEFLFHHLNNDLVEDALKFLSQEQLDEKDYTRLILEILKLNKDKGYEFMRKSPMYREVNQRILNELSDDQKGEKDYALLRIELLESSFTENTALRGELSSLICSTLFSLYNDQMKENLKELHAAYRETNKLLKDKWPKISWIDFLSFTKVQDYQTFIDLYIKGFELANEKDTYPDEQLFTYYKLYTTQDVAGLLEFGDYSSAERVALGKCAAQQKPFYKHEIGWQGTVDRKSLLLIFKHYVSVYEQQEPVEPAIQHFVDSYGNYFSPVTLIKLLPSQFPLAYLAYFLRTSFINMQAQSREKVITKAIIKSELSRTKHLINDFL
ncbi:hypothetical protein KGF57_001586 [Candida theae]|uniref:CNH domain-containing protein n=1 Tax=Candida theae TaxID=1198502 RepID=A0AAD5FZN4_9ASCO|nr:uncharacterized protein KGF57_001586 [Candida theae]KAI5961958.1 hypothetical protein KGF57_001586 [Candida theae]